jgi:hypothetical protein
VVDAADGLRYLLGVRLPVDSLWWSEVERFALRFTCVDCLHFLAATDGCAHFWPNAEHKAPPRSGTHVVFCKEFELL